MANAKSGSFSETYAETKQTVEVTVVPRIMTQSQEIARYFTDDLKQFLKDTRINLARELQIPPEYTHDQDILVEMLFDDLTHMLRDGLITGIHLLLSDPNPDKNTGAYPLTYHARYVINMPERNLKVANARQFGGRLSPPKKFKAGTRFALLIDWNPNANERRRQVRKPDYCFNWVPETVRYDETTVVRFNEGGMTVDSATVTRFESK